MQMTLGNFRHRPRRKSDRDGYLLLSLLLMMFFLAIAMMTAATSAVQKLHRDREEEMIHRGVQYERAIKRYMRKFGRYPRNIEDLENTNNVRCLRRRYKDPMSASGAWRIIRYGEVQLGQPGDANLASTLQAQADAAEKKRDERTEGDDGSRGGNANASSDSAALTAESSPQVFGGAPMIGVCSTSLREGIREFNGKSRYNQWQFIYDPSADRGALITGPYQPSRQLAPAIQGSGNTTVRATLER